MSIATSEFDTNWLVSQTCNRATVKWGFCSVLPWRENKSELKESVMNFSWIKTESLQDPALNYELMQLLKSAE